MEITIDKIFPQVFIDGIKLPLTRREFDVFVLLHDNQSRTCTRKLIQEQVWGINYYSTERVVDVIITRLRRKLGKLGVKLVTRKGFGYYFAP